MKKLFFLLSLSAPIFLWSQTISFPTENAHWVVEAFYYDDTEQQYNIECYEYFTDVDTIINGKTYTKIDGGFTLFFGAIREENGKVWLMPYSDWEGDYWFGNTEEYLMFDFTVNTGDSLMLYGFSYEYVDSVLVAVSNVDTVEMGGMERRRIHFSNLPSGLGEYGDCQQMKWIEGIGSTDFSPFYWWGICPVFSSDNLTFECMKLNGEVLYGDCNCHPGPVLTDIDEPASNESLIVFPNPTRSILYLDLSVEQPEDIQLEIINTAGKIVHAVSIVVLPDQTFTLDLSSQSLPPAIYYLRVLHASGIEMEKIFYID